MRKNGLSLMLMVGVLFLSSTNLYAQNNTRPRIKKTGQEIASSYINAIVKVITVVKWSNGTEEKHIGSGFFLDKEGYFATSAHVVKSRPEIRKDSEGKISMVLKYQYSILMKNDAKEFDAEIIGVDQSRDVAILKAVGIKEDEFKPATLGNSETLQVGDPVFAYGAPGGISETFTHGIVSALHRHHGMFRVEDFIQMDDAINPGNSGGPLINEYSEVIGMVALTRPDMQGIHYATPINFLDVSRLKKGDITMGYLGIKILLDNFPRNQNSLHFDELEFIHNATDVEDVQTLTKIAEMSKDNCAIITNVKPNSPADRAGLKRGDIVRFVNEKKLKCGRDILTSMLDISPGKEFEITVTRIENNAPKEKVLKAKLDEPKPEELREETGIEEDYF